jgi:hypothetical protein
LLTLDLQSSGKGGGLQIHREQKYHDFIVKVETALRP